MRIPVLNDKEWVSIIPRAGRDEVTVVRESGEELVVGIDADEPIEAQVSAMLASGNASD